jgi:pimeloyl-ACP methyl ester carboxylesterase
MVISILLVLGLVVAIGARWGLKPSFGIRFLVTAARLPRHRAALTAMCAAPPAIPPDVAKTFPIHIAEWGEIGPRVLLIHGGVQGGLGGGPETFREQAVLAKRGWRVLVADRPGFGRSPSRGPDDMAADSEWVAAHVGDGAHLIGHSFGGAVALLAAARQPSAVRSLIMIEPALVPLIIGSKAMKSETAAREDFLRMIQSWVSTRTPAEYARALMQNLGVAQVANDVIVGEGRSLDEQRAHAVGCAFLRARLASRSQLRQAARAVADARIPVLVVTGGWSPTFEAVGAIAAELTGGRHVVVTSPNHFVQMAAADAFNQVVAEFMRAAMVPRAPG